MVTPIKIKKGKIAEYLKKKRPEIDKIIEKYLPKRVTKKWLEFTFGKPKYLYSKKAAQKALLDPCWDFLSRGGKRWRPVLFLLITEAIGGDIEKVKDFVVIPELIHNGCLTEDSYVLKNPGEQVKITEIKKGDYVYTLTSTGKLTKNRVLSLKFNGIKKVYKLITRNREIEATENHPFLVRESQPGVKFIWRPLKKLKPKDKIVVLNQIPKNPLEKFSQLGNAPNKIFQFEKIKKIGFVSFKPVYDLEVENSHNFIANNIVVHNSIIIDDIEDQSEMRRGKPCLHKIFGQDIAINAGNFLYYLPLFALIKNRKKFKPETLLKAYELYIKEAANLHFGQATDIYWHKGKQKEIDEKEYLQMCAFKTGCLSRFAAKLAVILSGGSEKLAEKAGKVAEAIGIAFQIQDDILNLTGEEFAKRKGGLGEDITEGKRSLLVIYALKKANKKDRKRLLEILNLHTKDQKLRNEAIEIIKKTGAIEYAKNLAKKLIKDAWKEADAVLPKSKAKERLREFVNYLVERKI